MHKPLFYTTNKGPSHLQATYRDLATVILFSNCPVGTWYCWLKAYNEYDI